MGAAKLGVWAASYMYAVCHRSWCDGSSPLVKGGKSRQEAVRVGYKSALVTGLYLVIFTVIPDTARRKSTPCPTPVRLMTTPMSFRIDVAPIPPPTVPDAVAATYVPAKSLTFFKLWTFPTPVACLNPTATTSRPLTLKWYCFPLSKVRVPLPHDHPTPRAAEVAVRVKDPEGLDDSWAIALLMRPQNTALTRQSLKRVWYVCLIRVSFLHSGSR